MAAWPRSGGFETGSFHGVKGAYTQTTKYASRSECSLGTLLRSVAGSSSYVGNTSSLARWRSRSVSESQNYAVWESKSYAFSQSVD